MKYHNIYIEVYSYAFLSALASCIYHRSNKLKIEYTKLSWEKYLQIYHCLLCGQSTKRGPTFCGSVHIKELFARIRELSKLWSMFTFGPNIFLELYGWTLSRNLAFFRSALRCVSGPSYPGSTELEESYMNFNDDLDSRQVLGSCRNFVMLNESVISDQDFKNSH